MAAVATLHCSPQSASRARGLRTGASRFRFQAVVSRRLVFVTTAECLACGQTLVIERGEIWATLTVGNEFVGLCCDACLSDDSRRQLLALRGAAEPGG